LLSGTRRPWWRHLAVLEDHQRRDAAHAVLVGVCGLSSMLILTTASLPVISASRRSNDGAICLHGPHIPPKNRRARAGRLEDILLEGLVGTCFIADIPLTEIVQGM